MSSVLKAIEITRNLLQITRKFRNKAAGYLPTPDTSQQKRPLPPSRVMQSSKGVTIEGGRGLGEFRTGI